MYAYFRRTFDLDGRAKDAICHITAERFYRFWINGQAVGQGPVWQDPEDRSYDSYEIGPLVRQGVNVVAALVHMPFDESGRYTRKRIYVEPSRPGLFCELDIADVNGNHWRTGTDADWKGRQASAWNPSAPFRNDLSMQEWCDLDRDADWNRADYDDSEWPQALVIGDAGGNAVDGGLLPWRKLTPRPFPMLNREMRLPRRARSGEVLEWIRPQEMHNPAIQMSLERLRPLQKADVKGTETLIGEQGECILRNSDPHESLESFDGVRCATVILDFGRVMNAHAEIELEGEAGALLDVGYSQTLLEEEVRPYRSDRRANADRLVLRQGECSWRSLEYRSFRYMQLTLRLAEDTVVVRRVSAEEVTHPWPTEPEFQCSDQELREIWDGAKATVRLCATDRFCDNTIREHRQYQDSIMLGAVQAMYGDTPFLHHYQRQTFKHQLENGSIPTCCPGLGDFDNMEADVFLYGIPALWEHYEAFGEKDFLAEFWPKIPAFLEFLHGKVNSRGMLCCENLPGLA